MTTPQRWQEIDRIFAAALERDPKERARFVAEVCSGDEELRKEVESLIAHDLQQTLGGNQAVEEATKLLVTEKALLMSGQRVGPYQIIKAIGAGGMGQVYLAEDNRLNRSVALKL